MKWPWSKPAAPPSEPPAPPKEHFDTIDYQVGDSVVCINDEPHRSTHQALLAKGDVYSVRSIEIANPNVTGYVGPWVRLVGIMLVGDGSWFGSRFKKVQKLVKKTDITEQVMLPSDLDVTKERELAKELYK